MSAVHFVILHHRQPGGEHWDLMIEQAQRLATWQLLRNPLDRPGETIPARRIGDHRKAYLDYEGPVSGNRGTVGRVESGVCTIEEAGESKWRVHLEGRRLTGAFELIETDEATWAFQPAGCR